MSKHHKTKKQSFNDIVKTTQQNATNQKQDSGSMPQKGQQQAGSQKPESGKMPQQSQGGNFQKPQQGQKPGNVQNMSDKRHDGNCSGSECETDRKKGGNC